MNKSQSLTQQLLEREAQSWSELAPADYDGALVEMLDSIGVALDSVEMVSVLLALASVTLRRNSPTLTESRARCAEYLLSLESMVLEPVQRLRVRQLFLLAWLHLGAVVERGPASIQTTPPLPPGVVFPNGVSPNEIADPALRELAKEASRQHQKTVERWNAKQRALYHLNHLARLVHSSSPGFVDDKEARQELATAMSLASGLSPELRRLLEEVTGQEPD